MTMCTIVMWMWLCLWFTVLNSKCITAGNLLLLKERRINYFNRQNRLCKVLSRCFVSFITRKDVKLLNLLVTPMFQDWARYEVYKFTSLSTSHLKNKSTKYMPIYILPQILQLKCPQLHSHGVVYLPSNTPFRLCLKTFLISDFETLIKTNNFNRI